MTQSDKLYYWSRSADKPPGSGSNEFVTDPGVYQDLRVIENWRKKLSNLWVAPFEVNGRHWNSVEHMFQGTKIGLANADLGFTFCVESGSTLSSADGSVAQSKRRIVTLSEDQLAQWNSMKADIVLQALRAKFTQNTDLKALLLATHDAELWHGAPRTPASRSHSLETVRSEIFWDS